jgi:hypothetical protein
VAVLDWLQQLLGGGQYGDPGVPAMSVEPLEGTLRTGGALGQGGLPADGAQGYTGDVLQHLKDVISGKVAYEGVLGPGYQGDNRALDIAGGLVGAIKPRAPGGIAAPMIGKGTETPLFDLSRLTERPDMPQTPIERMPPPAKGIPDWLQAQVNDPAMREQYKQVLQLGRETAGDTAALGWWNTMPLREQTIGHFGDAAGDAAWRSDMNMLSATSPRSAFPANIRQASYFANLLAEGRPLPELVKKYSEKNPNAFNLVPVESAPKGYANFPLHIQNIQNLLQPDRVTLGNAYPLTNPKPATMAQNLVGNWGQPTIDVRDLKAMGLTDKSGKALQSVDPASTYGYIESTFHQPLARELGLDPAQMQSATWLGVPEYFQGFDKSGLTPALGTLEDSIRRTGKALGLTPEQVLRRGWFGKEFKLLSGGGLGVGLLGNGVDDDERSIQ